MACQENNVIFFHREIYLDTALIFYYKADMELNTKKIESELKRTGKSKYWLAKKIGVPIQNVLYWMKTKSLKGADPIAVALGYEDPKDLIR